MFPIQQYQLTPRDVQSVQLEPVRVLVAFSVAGNTLTVDSETVPQDKLWFIQHLSTDATAGAGQTLTSLELRVINLQLSRTYRLRQQLFTAAPIEGLFGFDVDAGLLLIPGEALQARAVFNAGAVINTVQLFALGAAIPRGNIAL